MIGATAAMLIILSAAVPAGAAPTLDFHIAPSSSGLISYVGGTAPVLGAGIPVQGITGIGTPLNAGVTIPCPECTLAFATGPLIGFEATRWPFGPGGHLEITTPSKLVSPQVTLVEVLAAIMIAGVGLVADPELFPLGVLTLRSAIKADRSTPAPELLDFFGLPGAGDVRYAGRFDLAFPSSGTLPPDAFAGPQVLGGDILVSAVPEPATLLLLGGALLVVMLWARRAHLMRASWRVPRPAPWALWPARPAFPLGLAPTPDPMLRSHRSTPQGGARIHEGRAVPGEAWWRASIPRWWRRRPRSCTSAPSRSCRPT